MRGSLLFLGTGGSMGVPVIGCQCFVCTSTSSFNKRARPGALLRIEEKNILIDASQDLRMQLLRFQVRALDGVIITHAHHDHTAGIDDLRALHLLKKIPIPLLVSHETFAELEGRYRYLFHPSENTRHFFPQFDLHFLEGEQGELPFLNWHFGYFSFRQMGMKVNGFRFGDLAYLSDIKEFSPQLFEILKGVKTLVISALRFTPSPMHLTVDEAVMFIETLEVPHAWLTHIAHELDHEKTNAYLPKHVRVAYDGLEISFEIGKSNPL